MKTNKKQRKNNNGITLIALVITIIVLLILAGVSIAMLTGENGILTQAQTAKEETEKASVIEKAQTDLLGKQAESQNSKVTAGVLKQVLEKYFKDVPSEDKLTVDSDITTKDEYGNYTMKVSDIYNGEIKFYPIEDSLEIGTEVYYNPSGKYNWQAKYYTTNTNDRDISLDSSEGGNFKISKWKILDILPTGEVELIPDDYNDATGTVSLFGAQGYNNGVKLLNEACSYLYGFGEEKKEGITARSINIEDIEGYIKPEVLEKIKSSEIWQGISGTKYGEKIQEPLSQIYSYYPYIYSKEYKSVIGNENNSEDVLKRSEQDNFIEPNQDGATNGYLNASSIQPYQTFWSFFSDETGKTAYKEINNSSNVSNYYDLLYESKQITGYYVASRCVDNSQMVITQFAIFIAGKGYGGPYFAPQYYSYNNNSGGAEIKLFPIVTVDLDRITGSKENGFYINID